MMAAVCIRHWAGLGNAPQPQIEEAHKEAKAPLEQLSANLGTLNNLVDYFTLSKGELWTLGRERERLFLSDVSHFPTNTTFLGSSTRLDSAHL